MKTSDFNYELPPELIAQTPIQRRDASRLLVLDKNTGAWQHRHFYDLPEYLRPGDCLILNNSRVLPARLLGHRLPGGGACEILLRVLPENRLCGIVRCIGREGESRRVLTLGELKTAQADMFCTVFIGNAAAQAVGGNFITPRGYRDV